MLAAVFLSAALPKIADLEFFARIIGAYGLLPEILLLPAAGLLVLTELAAAVLLLCGRREGLGLSGVLLLLFITILCYGIYLGLDIDCGCFGAEDPEHLAFSGLRPALIRDLLLCIPLGYGWWYRRQKKTEPYGERR